jgi:hypothetical protein
MCSGGDGTGCGSSACCLRGQSTAFLSLERDGDRRKKGAAHETWTKSIGARRADRAAGRVAGGRGPGPAHAGVLTPRLCHQILSGDGVRRLDICARGWVGDARTVTRGVVEMHTYALLGGINDWVDSRSQSITLEWGRVFRCRRGNPCTQSNTDFTQEWGQGVRFSGQETCRVNGPGGSVGCSVPNTYRVAFYGPKVSAPDLHEFETMVRYVSWRDDRGVAHPRNRVDDPEYPEFQFLRSPRWYA